MSIALSINGRFLTQPISGVQRYAWEVVRQWDAMIATGAETVRGADVELLCPEGAKLPAPLAAIRVRTVGRLQGHAWEQWSLPLAARGRRLINLCNTAPLLHGSQMVTIHDAAVFSAPFGYSRKFIAWYRFLYRALVARGARIVTVSAFSRDELHRYLGAALDIDVIHESGDHIGEVAPDASLIQQAGLDGRRFVLAVSSMNPNKNFAAIVKAFETGAHPDVELVVAGGTNPKVFAAAGALPPGVRHLGYVTDGQLRALYEAAACFAFPSHYEGFGLPPLEAMVCGCPVVSSSAASMPEICGPAALYFDPDDPAELARRLDEVLGDPAIAVRLRAAGHDRVRQFTWQRCAASLWAIANASAWPASRNKLAVSS